MSKEYKNTKRWDDWLANGGRTEGRDVDLSVPIPVNIGCGVRIERDGKLWTSTREYGGRDKKYLKTVTLNISSWRGISAGAVHYYGNLHTSGVEFDNPEEKNRFSTMGHGVPDYLEPVKVELTRVLAQEEIDKDPKRWEYYYAGNDVGNFDTVDQVIERGKEVFKRLFPKGWKFVVKKSWESKVTVIKR